MDGIPSPIGRLNHDILQNIFLEFSVDPQYQSPCSMPITSAVCHEWRALAFQTPGLWTNVCACAFVRQEQRAAHIEASRNKGLDVAFLVHSPGLVEVLATASRYIKHMRRFSIVIREEQIELQEPDSHEVMWGYVHVLEAITKRPSLKLERLNIVWDVGDIQDDFAPTIRVYDLDTPNLTWMQVDGVRLFCAHIPDYTFRVLSVLCLYNLRAPFLDGMSEIAELAARCPRLECLSLDYALVWSPGPQHDSSISYLPRLRSILIRDDIQKIAVFLGIIACPEINAVRIWAVSSYSELGVDVGRATLSIMRSSVISAIAPLKFAHRIAVSFSDSNYHSVGWSTSVNARGPLWDGISDPDVRPSSLDAGRDAVLGLAFRYEAIIHIVSDNPPRLSYNPGILNSEHIIRQFLTSQRQPRRIDTFCARGVSFALAEYISGLRTTGIYIDQAHTPLHNWLAGISLAALKHVTTLHVCQAYLSEDASLALRDLSGLIDVTILECIHISPEEFD